MKENHHHHQKTVETSPTSLKVQVVKAVDLKAVDGPDPDVLVNIRMISGDLSSPYQSTKLTDDCPGSSYLMCWMQINPGWKLHCGKGDICRQLPWSSCGECE